LELAAQLGGDFLPLGDPALLGIYRRQQELSWTEHLVERIENELEAAGVLGRPERVPAMSFLDLTGYTHLTEQQGDATAAALAETLAVLVNRSSREHGGVPVKWLGDGVMIHHRDRLGRGARQSRSTSPSAGRTWAPLAKAHPP
jgi:adenylate cyclase